MNYACDLVEFKRAKEHSRLSIRSFPIALNTLFDFTRTIPAWPAFAQIYVYQRSNEMIADQADHS